MDEATLNQPAPDCVAPGEIAPGDLIAWVDGDASAAVAAHIAACAHCLAEAAGLARAAAYVGAAAVRGDCPDVTSLLQFEAGLLARADARSIAAHTAGCAACRAELDALGAVAPAAAGRTGESWWRALGRRVVTAVSAPVPAAALRGGSGRPLHFQADEFEIALLVEDGGDGRRTLSGTITTAGAPPAHGGDIRLLAPERHEAPLDEFGAFTLPPVPSGPLDLLLLLDDVVVRFPLLPH